MFHFPQKRSTEHDHPDPSSSAVFVFHSQANVVMLGEKFTTRLLPNILESVACTLALETGRVCSQVSRTLFYF